MDDNTEVMFLLGKLDGKMDSLLTNYSAMVTRIDNIDTRVSQVEKEVSGISGGRTSVLNWLAIFIGTGSIIATVIVPIFEKILGAL